ncbi:MAG: aspartate carbamoyltransferase catalytic subunit [Pseudomonadota bacterium]
MSSDKPRSYLRVRDLSIERTQVLFSRATEIKSLLQSKQKITSLQGKQVVLFFSEASTRTKMSFQMAAQRLGAQCLMVDDMLSSSMSKGETFADTYWTLHALRPDLIVVRCDGDSPLDEVAEKTESPIINGGFGSLAHPTQALLDVFTLRENFSSLDGLRVLLVGDIDHSRVAASDIRLLKDLGAEVRICAPDVFNQKNSFGLENFTDLNKAIAWCQIYMGLRVQFERHGTDTNASLSKEQFVDRFSLSQERLKYLSSDAIIMHPGPVNWGIEFQEEVARDLRFRMWQQKENGVYVRAALMEALLKEKA